METRKNRSSVFDIFIISMFLGLIISRVAFIVLNWSSVTTTWWWLPYERYGNEVYWFRLLPWKFLNIFDGGLYIPAMFFGFILSASFWATSIKKWKWNQTFPTVFFSGETMLAFSFILLGLASKNVPWVYKGVILLLFPIISLFCIRYVNKMEDGLKEKKIYLLANVALILLSTGTIAYIYLSEKASLSDQIFAISFVMWAFLSLIAFIKDSKQSNIVIERVSSVRGIDINQPIKFPK